jgi:hypothetical protein
MNDYFKSIILQCTGASSLFEEEIIQELWSGYGKIMRLTLKNSVMASVVVKYVQLPISTNHPRGWNTQMGHQRKLKSYDVEAKWYDSYSKDSNARLPKCLAIERKGNDLLIVMEDMNLVGYSLRKKTVAWEEISSCLAWLAQFHASYLGKAPNGLWKVGTYWHLNTRPQELAMLKDERLKEAAHLIDKKLNECEYKTLVHGDAKLANFCFDKKNQVAGVDFQYVGGGCGMKDVAYFIGSCLSEKDCEQMEEQILNTYFKHFQNEMKETNKALEIEWRALYRVAWADFHRFIKGWSPGHCKITNYSERITTSVINDLR